MWAFWARNGRHDRAHVQFQRVGINGRVIRIAPEPVFLGIGFDQGDNLFLAARVAQVTQGFIINWEEATCRAIFRRHVGDGRAIRQRQAIQTFAVEFNEFANHAFLAQHFHNFQHKVSACRAFHHCARQFKANHFGDQHRDRLTKHRGLCLDTANAPSQNSRAIDHGGVAVCANKRIRIGDQIAVLIHIRPNRFGQIFKVHLVTNPRSRRHNAEIIKRVLTPFEKGITLHVALIFAIHIHLEGPRIAKLVNHHGVVNDQIHGVQRVDLVRVAAKRLDPVPHRGQIHHRRHACEILHQNAGGAIGDLARVLTTQLGPFSKGLDVIDTDRLTIFESQHILQHHFQRGRQF